MNFGVDKWIMKAVVKGPAGSDPGNHKLRVIDYRDSAAPVAHDVFLPPGDHWLYSNQTTETDDWPSLYDPTETRLAQALGGTWQIRPHTPTDGLPNSSIEVIWSLGRFRIDWANSTANPRWYGYDEDETGVFTSPLDGSALESPYSVGPQWQSWSHAEGRASEKEPFETAEIYYSSDRLLEADSVIWTGDKGRRMVYPYVWGAAIWPERANNATEASQAGLGTGDVNNGFLDVWKAFKNGEEIILVHDEGDQDQNVHSTHPGKWEVVKGIDPAANQDSRKLWRKMELAGRQYEITATVGIVAGSYDH